MVIVAIVMISAKSFPHLSSNTVMHNTNFHPKIYVLLFKKI